MKVGAGLGSGVLVLPYHNPIRLAKTAATLESRREMALYVQGSPHLGVAQALLDYLWVDPLPEHQRSVGTAGIVESITLPSHRESGHVRVHIPSRKHQQLSPSETCVKCGI